MTKLSKQLKSGAFRYTFSSSDIEIIIDSLQKTIEYHQNSVSNTFPPASHDQIENLIDALSLRNRLEEAIGKNVAITV